MGYQRRSTLVSVAGEARFGLGSTFSTLIMTSSAFAQACLEMWPGASSLSTRNVGDILAASQKVKVNSGCRLWVNREGCLRTYMYDGCCLDVTVVKPRAWCSNPTRKKEDSGFQPQIRGWQRCHLFTFAKSDSERRPYKKKKLLFSRGVSYQYKYMDR